MRGITRGTLRRSIGRWTVLLLVLGQGSGVGPIHQHGGGNVRQIWDTRVLSQKYAT